MTDETQDILPAEEVIEEPEIQETEIPVEEELTPDQIADLRKQAKKAEDQEKRAIKAEDELKKLKAPKTQPPADHSANNARLDRIELNSLGIKDREEQDFVLGAAKRLGVEPSEAANDPIVATKLEKMREERATKDATPRPRGGGGAPVNNVTKLAEKALQTGDLPTDPELRKKVQAEMRRISK